MPEEGRGFVRIAPPRSQGSVNARGGDKNPLWESPHERSWLEGMRRAQRPVEVVCLDGIRLQGVLVNYDRYSLILRVHGEDWMVYKHAVLHVRPAGY